MYKRISACLKQTFHLWNRDNPALLSAGIAYFTLFSIIPALMILVAIAGHVFEPYISQARVMDEVSRLFSPETASAIQSLILTADRSAVPATFLGLGLLAWGATRAFSSIQSVLDSIWESDPRKKIHHFFLDRLKALFMMAVVGILLSVFFALDISLAFIKHWLPMYMPRLAARFVMLSISYALFVGLFGLIFSMIFKFLPHAKVPWKSAVAGGIVSTLLFSLARYLIALYFSYTAVVSVYGAAGSVIVMLIWVYFSAQILLFGAAFTRAWSTPTTP